MEQKYLYEIINSLELAGLLKDIPDFIYDGLSSNIELREYQKKAFQYFITYYENEELHKNKQIHNLFHMATGSGKTVIMAGLILYLYSKGYRKFLFFVNQSNVVEKTKENFTNTKSNKYLFSKEIEYKGNKIKIEKVDNFNGIQSKDNIQICFTTTQKLHYDLFNASENSLTYHDFEDNEIVFISDESHHVNTNTKKETKDETEERNSWEYTVSNAFSQNKNSIMLEFTATADLKDVNVLNKYRDKIIFDYQLKKFRESGYTKDFQNFATESELWDRTLMALIMSEYRRYLFNDNKLNVKPVVMLKSQKIDASKKFYEEFFEKVRDLSSSDIKGLLNADIEILSKALKYFEEKDESFELLTLSIKNSFTIENSIIMNETTDNSSEKQLLVNSLEDKDNPIRIIFTVDMLNEGWDVLNLYDIVRLYDTRQGSGKAGKIGAYTIKEAQLIGRGARYCPFQINAEQEKYKRKYDNDLSNELRILETMYFHSRNDSKYIAELKQALIETGLQDKDPIKLEYIVKDSYKKTESYKKGFVFANKRIPKSRDSICDIEGSLKNKTYRYIVKSNQGKIISLMDDDTENEKNRDQKQINEEIKTFKFKEIDYNILAGASERFSEFKFDFLKEKYPNIKTLKEFLTSENYLGNSNLEIKYVDKFSSKELRNACVKAFEEIAKQLSSIQIEYEGTRVFEPLFIKDVFTDKNIYLSKIEENGGKGASQITCSNDNYKLDLSKEDWYIYNDNYGTSEEKLFIKYFKTNIAPQLDAKNVEYYVFRNERIPSLAIYSFDHGERFEPDFLIIAKRKKGDNEIYDQCYAEPKGSNLLLQDKWKEDFMISMESNTSVIKTNNSYSIIGFPFFNAEQKMQEFEKAILDWINSL